MARGGTVDSLTRALLWCGKGKVRLPFALCLNVLDMTRLFQFKFSARKGRIGRDHGQGAVSVLL